MCKNNDDDDYKDNDDENDENDNRLADYSTEILRNWFRKHIRYPYPNNDDKIFLSNQTGLCIKQVTTWFTNTRKRVWQPQIDLLKKKQASILASSNFRFSYSDNIDEYILQQLEQCDIFAEFNTYEIIQKNNNVNDNNNGFRALPPPPELIPVDCCLSDVLNSDTISPSSFSSYNNDNNKRTYENAFLVNSLKNTMKNLDEIYAIPEELRPRPRKRQKTKHVTGKELK